MNEEKTDITREKSESTPDRQTYLYHKQETSRHRHPPNYQPTGGARKGPVKDLGQQTLFTNLRIALTVAAIMLLLLVIAVVIAKKGWELKNRTLSRNRPVAHAASKMDDANEEGEELITEEIGIAEQQENYSMDGKPLDTSAIREAVFLARRGQNQALAGDINGAIELYVRALEIWPHQSQVWAQLGQAYLRQGEYGKAEVALSKAVEQDPANPQLLNDLGVAYLYLGEFEQAEELFHVASEVDEEFVDAYFNQALCSLSMGHKDEAREQFSAFLLLKPNDARALKELAYMDAAEGNYTEARKALQQAIQDRPDWAMLYFDAAAASALIGEMEPTFRFLEKAAELTGPGTAYKVYLQPAFKEMRLTELGSEFEKNLAAQARELMNAVAVTNKGARVGEEVVAEEQTLPLSTVTVDGSQKRSGE